MVQVAIVCSVDTLAPIHWKLFWAFETERMEGDDAWRGYSTSSVSLSSALVCIDLILAFGRKNVYARRDVVQHNASLIRKLNPPEFELIISLTA